jgi:hypothetical protein
MNIFSVLHVNVNFNSELNKFGRKNENIPPECDKKKEIRSLKKDGNLPEVSLTYTLTIKKKFLIIFN